MEKRWSKTETAHLKRYAETKTPEELAQRLHTDPKSVRQKLEQLGLVSGRGSGGAASDAAVKRLDKALKLLYTKKWKKAAAELEKILGEASTSPALADRARQYIEVCHRRQDDAQVDGEDFYLQAVYEKNEGRLDAALELCKKHGKPAKEERDAYLTAAIQALAGDVEKAIKHLETAIRLEPKNRVYAFHDPDFEALREEEAFANLVTSRPG